MMVTITINAYFWLKVAIFVLINILVGYLCYIYAESKTSDYYNQVIENLVKSGGIKLAPFEDEKENKQD